MRYRTLQNTNLRTVTQSWFDGEILATGDGSVPATVCPFDGGFVVTPTDLVASLNSDSGSLFSNAGIERCTGIINTANTPSASIIHVGTQWPIRGLLHAFKTCLFALHQSCKVLQQPPSLHLNLR